MKYIDALRMRKKAALGDELADLGGTVADLRNTSHRMFNPSYGSQSSIVRSTDSELPGTRRRRLYRNALNTSLNPNDYDPVTGLYKWGPEYQNVQDIQTGERHAAYNNAMRDWNSAYRRALDTARLSWEASNPVDSQDGEGWPDRGLPGGQNVEEDPGELARRYEEFKSRFDQEYMRNNRMPDFNEYMSRPVNVNTSLGDTSGYRFQTSSFNRPQEPRASRGSALGQGSTVQRRPSAQPQQLQQLRSQPGYPQQQHPDVAGQPQLPPVDDDNRVSNFYRTTIGDNGSIPLPGKGETYANASGLSYDRWLQRTGRQDSEDSRRWYDRYASVSTGRNSDGSAYQYRFRESMPGYDPRRRPAVPQTPAPAFKPNQITPRQGSTPKKESNS